MTKSSYTFCLSNWCVFLVNRQSLFIVQFKDAWLLTTGSSSIPILWFLGVDSTMNGYFVTFSCGGLPQPWNTLTFPMELGESLVCPSDYIVRLAPTALFASLVSTMVCMGRWSSLLWALGRVL